MINSVLANFISNAIKFSKESGTLRINYEVDGSHLQFSVINFGVGMSRKKIKSLFMFDTNETEPGTEGEQGTGFGLPIANRILALADGSLTIHSNHKKENGPIYTEMRVKIPCTLSDKIKTCVNEAA
jgi:signal transduction histidine kinase